MTTSSSWTPSAGLLEDLAIALGNIDALGHTTWFDTVAHQVTILTMDPEYGPQAPTEQDPDWQHREYELALRILEDADRYRRVPGLGAPGRLHEFIHSVRDAELQQALWDAKRGGRGAYRRVRGALRRRGLEQLWHDFEAEADRQLALDWLRSEGLLPDEAHPPE